MLQLDLFEPERLIRDDEPYQPLPDVLDNQTMIDAVERYNSTGSTAVLFSIWPAVQTAAYKIINKRLGTIKCYDRKERAEDVALRFFERIQRRYRKGDLYHPKRMYAVLWGISTYVLYNDNSKQKDREILDESL